MDTPHRPLSKLFLAILAALLISTTATRAAFRIVPLWDPTISNDVNASAITNTIVQALLNYQGTFSNNMTVTIYFLEAPVSLGESSTFYNDISYQLFRSQLVADATTIYNTQAM